MDDNYPQYVRVPIYVHRFLYIVIILSMITYNLPLLLNLKQYLIPLPLLWCFRWKRGCYNLERSIYHVWLLVQGLCQKYLPITPYEPHYKELAIFHSQFQFIRLHTNPISDFCSNPISSHPIFQFCLNFIPSDWNSHLNLNLISLYWNYHQITMTTTRPNHKREGTNIIIDKVYVVGDSLTLQYALCITPSYQHTGQIWLSKMMP